MRTSLPSASSAYAIASCEPIESPSGRACEVIRNRCRRRMSSRSWCRMVVDTGAPERTPRSSMSFVVFTLIWSRRGLRGRLAALGVEVPKDLLDAIAALDRFVEKELQLGDAPEADPLPDLPAQKRGDTLEGAARFL